MYAPVAAKYLIDNLWLFKVKVNSIAPEFEIYLLDVNMSRDYFN